MVGGQAAEEIVTLHLFLLLLNFDDARSQIDTNKIDKVNPYLHVLVKRTIILD